MKCMLEMWEETRGASSVVGIILVVGLTIIIAAVLGGTVFGIGNSIGEGPPQTQFSSEQVDGFTVYPTGDLRGTVSYVEFEHISGDNVNMENVRLEVNGELAFDLTDTVGSDVDRGDTIQAVRGNSPIVARDSCDTSPCHYTLTPDKNLSSGDTVRVVMKSQDGMVNTDGNSFTWQSDKIVYAGEDEAIQLEDGDRVRLLFEGDDSTFTIAEHEVKNPETTCTWAVGC